MSAIYRASGHGPRAAHVLAMVAEVFDNISRFLWIASYSIAERRHWRAKR